MADKKISQLTGATTPLAGTEVLPIVQSSSTVKVSVANLTAGRSVQTADLEAVASTAGVTKGDLYVDVAGKTVYLGRLSSTGGDNSTIVIRNRQNIELLRLEPGTPGWTAYADLVFGTAAKGVNFTANTPAAGMTSRLLNWYEEGTWTPVDNSGGGLTFTVTYATYTRIGRMVTLLGSIQWPTTSNTNSTQIGGVPFTAVNQITGNISYTSGSTADVNFINGSTTALYLLRPGVNTTNAQMSGHSLVFSATYFV